MQTFTPARTSQARSSKKFAHSRGPTPVSVPDCVRLPSGIILTSSGFLMILDGRAPQQGGWWLIGPGEWAIRVHLFSQGVDAWASLMGHTQERGDCDVRRGTFKKLLLVLAVSMAIGLGVSFASAATRCNPVLTPGENLARVAAQIGRAHV